MLRVKQSCAWFIGVLEETRNMTVFLKSGQAHQDSLCCPTLLLTAVVLLVDCSEQRELLVKCASTALSSKLVARQKDFFSHMVVDAVMHLDDLLPLNMIGIKKVQGGGLEVIARTLLTNLGRQWSNG